MGGTLLDKKYNTSDSGQGYRNLVTMDQPATSPSFPPLFSLKSHRLRLLFLFCTGLFVTSSMRLNLGFATVCMVNSTAYPAPILPITVHNTEERDNDSRECSNDNWTVHNGYNVRNYCFCFVHFSLSNSTTFRQLFGKIFRHKFSKTLRIVKTIPIDSC